MGHCYLEEKNTYVWIFGATGALDFHPAYVSDCLMLGEIWYETILQGFNASLIKDKKRDFIPYGFHIGYYIVKDTTHAKK